MNKTSGKETTFNQVVSVYDQIRPEYPEAVFKTINEVAKLTNESKLLEVGIGTGQATKPFLEAGCQVTAVELGDEMARFVKNKFSDFSNLEVVNQSFLDYEGQANSYDLIYSATAFHWIPEQAGYELVYDLLKEGGVFARFANRPYKDKGNPSLDAAIQAVYHKYRPNDHLRDEVDEIFAQNIAKIPLKYGFKTIEYHLYKRTRTFNAKEYANLLMTYSDVIATKPKDREIFLLDIMEAINNHGGEITIYDTIDLELAFK